MPESAIDHAPPVAPRAPRGSFQVGAGGRQIWLFELDAITEILRSRGTVTADRLARQLRSEAEATRHRRLGCKAFRFAAAPADRPVFEGAVIEARSAYEAQR